MKRNALLCLLAAGVSLSLASTALAQEGHEGEMDPMMAAMMKAGTPGEHHFHLVPFAGKWKTKTQFRMDAEQPWQESEGTSEISSVFGGRFLMERHSGSLGGGMPFEGMAITGYNNTTERYESVWIDSMSTAVMVSQGTCDASGKVFTYNAEYTCPMTGKPKKTRHVVKVAGNDRFDFEMYGPDDAGKEFLSLKISYTRQ